MADIALSAALAPAALSDEEDDGDYENIYQVRTIAWAHRRLTPPLAIVFGRLCLSERILIILGSGKSYALPRCALLTTRFLRAARRQ